MQDCNILCNFSREIASIRSSSVISESLLGHDSLILSYGNMRERVDVRNQVGEATLHLVGGVTVRLDNALEIVSGI